MTAASCVDITYVPADCGSIIPGKSKAPQAFHDVGIVRKLKDAGIASISEQQALQSPAKYTAGTVERGSVRNEASNIAVCQQVQSTILQNLYSSEASSPAFQLVLGGECCMLPAILSATWQYAETHSTSPRVGLIYIDADVDLASPSDPDSTGNLAGMNMTHLVHGAGALPSMQQFSRPSGEPVCDASNTVLFGINMDAGSNRRKDFGYLFDNNYRVISSTAVAQEPEQRAAQAIRYLEDNNVEFIMVHLDVDSIDPRTFPLANVPNLTGVSFEHMMKALRVLLANPRVIGLTVAEVNPDHDPELEMVEQLTDNIVSMLESRRR